MRRRRRLVALAPALVMAGCVAAPPIERPAPRPRFDAFAFFDGASEGQATLRVMFHRAAHVVVHSQGRLSGDGGLTLDQRIEQDGKPARQRTWRLRETAPGRYAGTLSDAAGPVTGETDGNRLHLTFTMKGGLPTDQWLTLAPDGQSAHNILVVRKFGLTIAVLDETIRRDPRLSAPVAGSRP